MERNSAGQKDSSFDVPFELYTETVVHSSESNHSITV